MPHWLIVSVVALVVIGAVIRLCGGFIDGLIGGQERSEHR